MIETDNVDLDGDFEIKFVDCDCALDFYGYSVETVHGSNDAIRLVRLSSPT
jgi:hypothetical protein